MDPRGIRSDRGCIYLHFFSFFLFFLFFLCFFFILNHVFLFFVFFWIKWYTLAAAPVVGWWMFQKHGAGPESIDYSWQQQTRRICPKTGCFSFFCIKMHVFSLFCIKMHVVRFFEIFWAFWSGLFSIAIQHLEIFWNILRFFEIFWDFSRFFEIFRDILRYFKIFWDIHFFIKKNNVFQIKHSPKPSDLRTLRSMVQKDFDDLYDGRNSCPLNSDHHRNTHVKLHAEMLCECYRWRTIRTAKTRWCSRSRSCTFAWWWTSPRYMEDWGRWTAEVAGQSAHFFALGLVHSHQDANKSHFRGQVDVQENHLDHSQWPLNMTSTQQPMPLIVNYKIDGRVRLVLRSNPKWRRLGWLQRRSQWGSVMHHPHSHPMFHNINNNPVDKTLVNRR